MNLRFDQVEACLICVVELSDVGVGNADMRADLFIDIKLVSTVDLIIYLEEIICSSTCITI